MVFHTVTITNIDVSPNLVICAFEVDIDNNVIAFYNGITAGSNNVFLSEGTYTLLGGLSGTFISAFPELDAIIAPENQDTQYIIWSNTIVTGTVAGTSSAFKITNVGMTFTPGCFNEGTKILCLKNELEEYVPIENLRKGDVVKTYKHGYKPIDMIGKKYLMNHPDNEFRSSMYKMAKTPENGLTDDLIVTGGHSLLVDSISNEEQERFNTLGFPKFSMHKIEDKHLLLSAVSANFVKLTDINTYTYYHFILENDDDTQRYGVWANGILTETMNKTNFMKQSFILL